MLWWLLQFVVQFPACFSYPMIRDDIYPQSAEQRGTTTLLQFIPMKSSSRLSFVGHPWQKALAFPGTSLNMGRPLWWMNWYCLDSIHLNRCYKNALTVCLILGRSQWWRNISPRGMLYTHCIISPPVHVKLKIKKIKNQYEEIEKILLNPVSKAVNLVERGSKVSGTGWRPKNADKSLLKTL